MNWDFKIPLGYFSEIVMSLNVDDDHIGIL